MRTYYVCANCGTWSGKCMEPTGVVFDHYSEHHLNEQCRCNKCGWVGTFASMTIKRTEVKRK